LASSTICLVNKNEILGEIRDKLKSDHNHENIHEVVRFINANTDIDQDWNKFRTTFEEVHPGFFDRLQKNHPQLTDHDIRLSSYLRINFTGGGTINVYGGNGTVSQWPTYANASITMNGGILDFKDQSITINTLSGFALTTNITGGIIRTPKGFFNGRSDFNPTGGTVELYGTTNSGLDLVAGSLWNLSINKAVANKVTVNTNSTVNGNLTLNTGTLQVDSKILFTGGNINLNSGGSLCIENGSILRITGNKALTVALGGTLKVIGTSGANSIITDNLASGYHEFQISGNISARYATFGYNYGINIWSTATVDPLNPFDYCTFQYGVDRFLFFGNNQEIVINGANFPMAALYNNVWKNNDAGSVTFTNATGGFAGETFENDPFNRIHWGAQKQLNLEVFLEGLYTGAGTMREASNETGPQFGAGVADEIKVEFRNALDYYETEYVADHVLLETNGHATVNIPAFLSGSYYITIRHRNSLETTTALPVSFTSNYIYYLFDSPSKAYGGNLLQMITGQYVIYSGDVNQDGTVDIADMTPVDNDASNFVSGYLVTDVNGDGVIDTADMTIVDNNAAGYVGVMTP